MTGNLRLGRLLRDARELRGMTVEQLARESRVPVAHIEALECGQFAAIPGAMYLRAEVRAYAEAVGIDPVTVVEQLRVVLETQASEAPSLPLPQVASAPAAAVHTPAVRMARAAIVLTLGCTAMLWQQGSEPVPSTLHTAMLPSIIEPADVMEEVARIVEAPGPAPTLHRAMFDPGIAANGKQWPRDGRLDEGVLVVRSTPAGARVTVNGVGWGVTPVAIRYLPFGTVRIRLGKTNHVSQERTVELSPTEPSRVLRVTLPAIPRKPESTVASPAVADMLVITTVPSGARVTVNGIGWGMTPVSIPHVPAGRQRVRVVKDDFRSEERVVTVSDGQPARVAISLRPVSE